MFLKISPYLAPFEQEQMISGIKGRYLLGGLIGIYALRIILTQFMGPMPQDVYYYYYSEHLALSYFDHPPMVAYLLYVFSSILGKSVAVIKIADFTMTAGSLYVFYQLGTRLLSKKQAVRATLFFGSTIMVSILSLNTTPDVPLIFFWTLSLLVLYKAIFEQKNGYWPLAGLLIGLSFDSKYTALFLLFGVFFFLLISDKYRSLLFSRSVLWVVLFFIIGITPVLLWNAQNDWVSLLFQSSGRADRIMRFSIRSTYFFGHLGTQLILLLPPLFIGLLVVLYQLVRKTVRDWKLPDDKQLFLLAFSLPLLGFFFLLSFIYWVKLNWMMPGYIAAILLAGRYMNDRLLSLQMGLAVVLHLAIAYQVLFYPFPVKTDDSWYGWEELATETKALQSEYPDHFLFSADSYKTSAVLNFYLDETVYGGNIIGEAGFQFAIVHPDVDHLVGQNALYFDSDKRMKSRDKLDFVPEKLAAHFDTVIQLNPIIITSKDGEMKRKFWVFEGRNYKLE